MLHEELASYISIVSCCIGAVVWRCPGYSYTKVDPIQPRQRTSLQPTAGRMVINTQNNSPVLFIKSCRVLVESCQCQSALSWSKVLFWSFPFRTSVSSRLPGFLPATQIVFLFLSIDPLGLDVIPSHLHLFLFFPILIIEGCG